MKNIFFCIITFALAFLLIISIYGGDQKGPTPTPPPPTPTATPTPTPVSPCGGTGCICDPNNEKIGVCDGAKSCQSPDGCNGYKCLESFLGIPICPKWCPKGGHQPCSGLKNCATSGCIGKQCECPLNCFNTATKCLSKTKHCYDTNGCGYGKQDPSHKCIGGGTPTAGKCDGNYCDLNTSWPCADSFGCCGGCKTIDPVHHIGVTGCGCSADSASPKCDQYSHCSGCRDCTCDYATNCQCTSNGSQPCAGVACQWCTYHNTGCTNSSNYCCNRHIQ